MTSLAQFDSIVMIADIARLLNDFRPLDATLDRICERAAGIGNYDASAIFMSDEEGRALVIRGSCGLDRAYIEHVNGEHLLMIHEGDEPVIAPTVQTYLTAFPRTMTDVQEDPMFRWKVIACSAGYRGLACTPVIAGARVIGVLNCYNRSPHEHTDDERELLQTVARLAGVAIETARIADAQRDAQRRLRELSERLSDQNRELSQLVVIQSRLADDMVQTDMSPVERTCRTLAETTGRAVLIAGPLGQTLAYVGSSDTRSEMALVAGSRDVAMRLQQRALVNAGDCSCARVGLAETSLGTVVMRPALNDDRDIAALATLHATSILAASMHSERAGATLKTHAAPAILLALAHGLYDRFDVQEVTSAFGIAPDTPVRIAALRCSTPESAYRLSRRPERLRSLGWSLVSATADGVDCLLLVEEMTPSRIRDAGSSTRERHIEVDGIGISGLEGGVRHVISAYRQALAAVSIDHETCHSVTMFDKQGPYGTLVRDLPNGRARKLADAVLEPLRAYDTKHGTMLLTTLATYVRRSGALRTTAAELNLHPRTVRQRLQRARELAGFDLRDYRSLGEVVVALNLDRLLRGTDASSHRTTPE